MHMRGSRYECIHSIPAGLYSQRCVHLIEFIKANSLIWIKWVYTFSATKKMSGVNAAGIPLFFFKGRNNVKLL